MEKQKNILGAAANEEKLKREAEPKEIERKFLVRSLPDDLDQYSKKEIVQGYLAIMEDGTEVRLRQKGDQYFQTVKSGGGKTRTESEIEITKKQYESLWAATAGRRVEKTRYDIPHEDLTIELDIYHGDLDGLLSAEVEFDSEQASDEFEPPEWFGKDVTKDKRYKNQKLALNGIPKLKAEKLVRERLELDIPTYELEEGAEVLTSVIKEKIAESDSPVIVEIAGGSASGKTSAVASKVKEAFGKDALIFSMDDYYRGRTFMDGEAAKDNELNWDQPEALNLELLKEHLAKLKSGESIDKPIYDMKVSESTGTEKLDPKKVIIVEGLFALNDTIEKEGDVKAFVDIGTHGRVLRRLLRDIERTGQKPADIIGYFSEVVEPMHEKYIEESKKNANMIVNNEYSPEVEAQKSGLHEVQLKFKAEADQETLRKLGAEKLSSTVQTDIYYNPEDRNLMETGEILRIREEAGHKTLTYKGPKVEGSEFRKRPKFEFEIDDDIEDKFLSIYGETTKTIKKDRIIYQLGGVVFSVDSVTKVEDGKDVDLGNFIEIRSTDKEANEDQIKEIITKLGLDINSGIKEAYFDM